MFALICLQQKLQNAAVAVPSERTVDAESSGGPSRCTVAKHMIYKDEEMKNTPYYLWTNDPYFLGNGKSINTAVNVMFIVLQ